MVTTAAARARAVTHFIALNDWFTSLKCLISLSMIFTIL